MVVIMRVGSLLSIPLLALFHPRAVGGQKIIWHELLIVDLEAIGHDLCMQLLLGQDVLLGIRQSRLLVR